MPAKQKKMARKGSRGGSEGEVEERCAEETVKERGQPGERGERGVQRGWKSTVLRDMRVMVKILRVLQTEVPSEREQALLSQMSMRRLS